MEITKSIINFFIASGVLAWLIRSIVKLYLDKDVEKFKADLERQLDIYKTLHSERMMVIKEIYKKIDNTFRSLESLICPLQLAGEPTGEVKMKVFADNFNIFSDFFGENKIFFNEELASDIESFLKELYSVWRQWSLQMELSKSGKSNIEEWGKSWDKLQKDVPLLKQKLEKMFRKLIGVN